jgi:hypothetical protein
MSLHEFNQLSFRYQKTMTYIRGRFLAVRWQKADELVKLYLMPEGFLVEMIYRKNEYRAHLLFAFESGTTADWLADYVPFVRLPSWMPKVEKESLCRLEAFPLLCMSMTLHAFKQLSEEV